MPPAKKQKNSRHSGVSTQDDHSDSSDSAFESVRPRKNNKRKSTESAGDESQNASKSGDPAKSPYDYITIHRPLFDVLGENWLAWSSNPSAHVEEEDVYSKLYKPNFEREKKDGIGGSPPEKHPEHKWVIMREAFNKRDLLARKAHYCNPDNFGMYIYNDWASWGILEIAENMMIEFNKAYQSKAPTRLEDIWVVISTVGIWLNDGEHMSLLISGEGDDVLTFIGLLGCALLTTLAAVEKAGELKPDSRFLDLTLVMAYYIEISYDLPAYGVEGDCVGWRKHLVRYFEKGNLDPAKGLSTTKVRIEKLKKVNNYNEEPGASDSVADLPDMWGDNPVLKLLREENNEKEKEGPEGADKPSGSSNAKKSKGKNAKNEDDVWNWVKVFKAYKKLRSPVMGGQHYDITKMSRAERAAAAFDHQDPLADIPAKELRNNLIDIE
ncbi:hypothetical protein COCC4DRAFT_122583 [Bipolaris maydis ATCC 48331]|uniref:Uncharacterized protein n=2 Tax=Cochliobolus heterostrophus TaxID=5016 RepID=M2UR14_COCH5|nr:uncharacterized protein COCC4DRAFT_122583 [Bipolaris maydis ATCC 48331]EMD96041.1 hypothetical protein COCHEDRAFT_1210289 [Bipolaris maydis C5]KAH7561916.1 hypothetical protein BM1_03020 [Bipolaris maydis]ENI10901.1 hypothetical protein COCC4DRAFT_122583 [Bipolaris maydis ATCC 48331]KAJ5030736.1 hypothetical protein J3E73DRAFT_405214 [Bipolaris maydis]KAJ5065755.1 hypothetical protein J3E74DRAFT_435756 [Bipolaris maydis]